MSSPKRLTELSAFLHEQVTKIDDYIALSDIPSPSFQATCPPTLKLPQDVDAARQAALEALDELRDHLLGPVGAVTEMALYVSRSDRL